MEENIEDAPERERVLATPTVNTIASQEEEICANMSTQVSSGICSGSSFGTQTPVMWHFRGTQTNPRIWTRGNLVLYCLSSLSGVTKCRGHYVDINTILPKRLFIFHVYMYNIQ